MENKKEKFASTDVIGLIDITPKKKYKIERWGNGDLFWIKDDVGYNLLCLRDGCSHLKNGNWILTNK